MPGREGEAGPGKREETLKSAVFSPVILFDTRRKKAPACGADVYPVCLAVLAVPAALAPSWPYPLVTLVAALFSATAVSWHGVLLAEVARLSPPGRIGSTTGAVLAFGDAGALVLPLLFSGALTLTGSYAPGFLIGGALALVIGLFGTWQRFGAGRKARRSHGN